MAAVLEMLLDRKVSVKNIISWLCHKECNNEEVTSVLQECIVASEFLPFFINYLRDQTAHLIYHGSSNAATPAKTPNSVQKLRRASLSNSKTKSNSQRGNRTKLFSPSSFKSDVSDADLGESSLLSLQSLDDSPVPMWDQNESASKHWKKNAFESGVDYSTKGKRGLPFGHKKEERVTFGEFVNKSDGQHQRGRRNKSPAVGYNLKDEHAMYVTPSNSKRRSGGKSRSAHSDSSSQKSKHKQRQLQTVSPPIFALNMEEFPSMGKSSPSPVPVRSTPKRITPTAVTSSGGYTGHSWSSSFSPTFNQSNGMCTLSSPVLSSARLTFSSASTDTTKNQPVVSESPVSRGLEKERELLRLERLKQGDYTPNVHVGSGRERVPSTPPKQLQTSSKSPAKSPAANVLLPVMEATLPSKDSVTFIEKLDLLADLYSACLQECLVSNLTVELYFLMQLLTAKGTAGSEEMELNKDRDVEDINYLCTIHNCVSFAVTVLHKQLGLLSLLDQSTLRLLSDNTSIYEFSLVLHSELEVLCNSCDSSHAFSSTSSPIQVVPFLADTDNRRNFPTDRSFHSFKKQRDKFYELIREWQAFHSKPGWRMKEAMSKRIKELVEQAAEVTNYTHFVRLFRSQLIRMCEGDLSIAVAEGDNTADLGFLSQLKKTNPEKFKRLEERFSMPTSSGGPCPPPSFPGCQEFFKEFIVAAENYTFNQHLIDSFSSKILEINEMQFPLSEQDSNQPVAVLDEEQKQNFSSCLHTLRVLAKFLGFVVFLPYQAGSQLPDGILEDVITVRNKSTVPLDVLVIIENCHAHCRLLLTLPWIVEYLSMMDSVAPQLQYYETVLTLLVKIYRMLSARLATRQAPYNVMLLLILLGWLFEIPCIPASLYFTAFSDDFQPIDTRNPETGYCDGVALDHLPWIDQQILYKCCLFLVDIRILLAQAALGVTSRTTPIRKITPVAADNPTKSIISTQQLQLELENNFFHNHSLSMKKTVEFVSTRIASNCIKSIDATLVSDARKAVVVMVQQLVSDYTGDATTTSSKSALLQKAKNKCIEMSSTIKEDAHKQGAQFVKSRCKAALVVLLLDDICVQVQDTATEIAIRLGMDRVTRWINTQVTAALQKELSSNFDKIVKVSQLAKKEAADKLRVRLPDVHDEECHSPSDVIQILKDLLRYLLVEPSTHPVTAEHIHTALTSVRRVLHSRQDLTPVGLQSIHSLTVDLAAALSYTKPDLMERVIPCDSQHTPVNTTKNETCPERTSNNCVKTAQETKCIEPVQEISNLRLTDKVNSDSITTNDPGKPKQNVCVHNEECKNSPNHDNKNWIDNGSLVNTELKDEDKSNISHHLDPKTPEQRSTCSSLLIDSFVKLWKKDTLGKVPASAFLCAKNVVLMEGSKHVQMCWLCIETIVQALADHTLTSSQEIYESIEQLLNSPYISMSVPAAMTALRLATQICNNQEHCNKKSDDELSDMDRMLQKIADRCCEPVVLEGIYNYYATTTQSLKDADMTT